jgi:hypothetical protein
MNGVEQSAKKRSETRQKGRVVPFRVSPDEYTELTRLAEREGLSLGSYVRSRSLEKPTTRAVRRPVVEEAVLSKLVAQLGRIGNNLNQIARGIHFGERFTQEEIQTALAQHRQILAAVIEALGRKSR